MTSMDRMPQPKTQANVSEAWPFYIVCDVSESMYGDRFQTSWGSPTSPWTKMNIELSGLIDALEEEPEASQVAHIAVVDFSAEAKSVLKLSVVSSTPSIGKLSQGTWTNYVGVWKYLSSLIPSDFAQLRAVDCAPGRPTIFFITDGNPGAQNVRQVATDWQPHVEALRRSLGALAPRVIAIGLGDVQRQTLLELHSTEPHGAAVIAERSGEASKLVNPLVEQIKNSVRDSTTSGQFTWTPPAGMISLCGKARH